MSDRKTAIIVGGAGGIGSEICRQMASQGHRVVVADYDLGRAREVLETLAGEGHDVVEIDVTNDERVNAAFDAVEARFPASILVTAFGGLLIDRRPLPDIAALTTAEWERTIAYNLTGVFFCLRKFAALRLANPIENSRIITLTSGAGQFGGTPTDVGYVASKAAIIGITRQAAYDLAKAGITVNTVAPGPIGTPEFYRHTTEEIRAQAASVAVLDRLGTPEEIARGVVFLAAPESSYITGTTFDINGGSHMH